MDSFLLGASSVPCPEAGASLSWGPLWLSGGGDWRPSLDDADDIVMGMCVWFEDGCSSLDGS